MNHRAGATSPVPRRTPLLSVMLGVVLAVMLGAAGCTVVEPPAPETVGPPLTAPPTAPPTAPATVSATAEAGASPSPREPMLPPPVPQPEARRSEVLAQLETVQVKGRAPKTDYDRDLFGRGWKDPDRNGCDARNDILRRDLTDLVVKPGTHGCVVLSGTLHDPYTGETIAFVRGPDTSPEVQIDHVVSLSDAWQKGAQQLDAEERIEFANDPLNLRAVQGFVNASKGDGDAATWLPPNRAHWCDFVARQTAVKAKHDLWMTQAEHDAVRRIAMERCPAQ